MVEFCCDGSYGECIGGRTWDGPWDTAVIGAYEVGVVAAVLKVRYGVLEERAEEGDKSPGCEACISSLRYEDINSSRP